MQDYKNATGSYCGGNGTVCIDTKRVLDSCRDRDCFENVRVYLTAEGEGLLANASNVRTKGTEIVCAYVGVEEVPFNCGFYKVVIKYYVEVELEACITTGRSQLFSGLAVLEKDVILYGGEGRAISFSSSGLDTYCVPCSIDTATTNDPTAIVDTVEPIILGSKVCDCTCTPCCTEYVDIPESVEELFGGEIVTGTDGAKIYVSFGLFSVIRMVRPAQLLVQATDYTVPDKECVPATNGDNPCALFRTMPFPTTQFKGAVCATENNNTRGNGKSGCGCK